jgi:putative DNA primase/helicase
LSTNHRPAIKGTDNAIWRRIRLIPFDVTIPPADQDAELAVKLEGELPGILRWCVDGCLAWQHQGLEPPAAVVVASRTYRENEDVLGDFLAACCELEPNATATAKELYGAYLKWCEDEKVSERERIGKKKFSEVLAERGLKPDRDNKNRYWWDIRLKAA